jgi:hypothetical protein
MTVGFADCGAGITGGTLAILHTQARCAWPRRTREPAGRRATSRALSHDAYIRQRSPRGCFVLRPVAQAALRFGSQSARALSRRGGPRSRCLSAISVKSQVGPDKCGMREIASSTARRRRSPARLRRTPATRSGGLEFRATTAQWHAAGDLGETSQPYDQLRLAPAAAGQTLASHALLRDRRPSRA